MGCSSLILQGNNFPHYLDNFINFHLIIPALYFPRYDCTDMSLFRSALSCCVVRGLANVRDYVHRDRHRTAEAKERHQRHHQHANNPTPAQQAGAHIGVGPLGKLVGEGS